MPAVCRFGLETEKLESEERFAGAVLFVVLLARTGGFVGNVGIICLDDRKGAYNSEQNVGESSQRLESILLFVTSKQGAPGFQPPEDWDLPVWNMHYLYLRIVDSKSAQGQSVNGLRLLASQPERPSSHPPSWWLCLTLITCGAQ